MNELVVFNDSNVYLSLDAEKERKVVANAIVSADFKIGDFINQRIRLKDLYIEPIEFTNKETGEVEAGHRIIMFDVDKKSYETCSSGIYNALKRICSVYGMPTWEEPITVEVKQVQRGADRKMLTLKIV